MAAISAALSDRRFIAAVTIAALSGFVRGFSGFGSALIYIPLIAAVYEPRIAAPTLLLIDLVGSAPFTIRELPRCNWREVAPVTTAAALAVPAWNRLRDKQRLHLDWPTNRKLTTDRAEAQLF